MSFKKLKKHLEEKLKLKSPKIVKVAKHIDKVALTTGSGGSLIPYIKADCFC